uniref:uncharacterized protein LOC122605034 n=1 Tax=Erigeron canadensis TaxID=72917 RepID=UPI001CB8C5CF|nr:uncharacterized protein LOC122605034 [Erigeron canadensis]
MKREGRQHGVVRSYPTLPPDPLSPYDQQSRRHVKTIDSALVKGVFTKVSRKPTNQSKFTGKCGKAQCLGCHIHPATKSKDKTKGTMKMRSIGSDHGQIGYPVGTSATGVLADLAGGIDDYIDDMVFEDFVNDRYYSGTLGIYNVQLIELKPTTQ